MRFPTLPLAFALLGAVAAPAAAEDRGAITTNLNFALGSSSVGDADGFLAPGAHFDVGFRVRRWRLAAEVESMLWSDPSRMKDSPPSSGSFQRAGMALRWNAMDVSVPRNGERPGAAYRIFVEAGVGREHIEGAGISLSRNDLMLGLGMAPEISFGRLLFGASFGVRALISDAPDDQIARTTCGECRPTARHDLTLLYIFGFTIGS